MAEFAPVFDANTIPKPTNPLVSHLVQDELIDTATGAAAGEAASATKARVKGKAITDKDGAEVETETLVGRNTAAADVAAIKSATIKKKPSFAMPRDLSGNGGPAFTRV